MVLSQLPESEHAARKAEATAVTGSIIAAATPAAVAAGQEALNVRWGPQILAEGWAALTNPWWFLKNSDGKPPVIAALAESALTNPNRSPKDVLLAFQHVKAEDRPALADAARAVVGESFSRAHGDARGQFVDLMRSRPEFNWPKDPWAALLPYNGGQDAPLTILLANVGETHDGGIYDNPEDDTTWEKLRFSIRSWDVDILKTNPLAQAFDLAVAGAGAAAGAVGWLAFIPWIPVVLMGSLSISAIALGVHHVRKRA